MLQGIAIRHQSSAVPTATFRWMFPRLAHALLWRDSSCPLGTCALLYGSLAAKLHLGFRGGPGGGGGFDGEPRNWFINSSTKYLGNDLFSFGPGSSVASPGCNGSFGSRPCL